MNAVSTVSTKIEPSKAVKAYRRKVRIAGMIEATIAGIPCLIDVVTCNVVKGSYNYNAPSDMDYYGYSEIEFDVYDRKGYRALWLEKKMTDDDRNDIEEKILA